MYKSKLKQGVSHFFVAFFIFTLCFFAFCIILSRDGTSAETASQSSAYSALLPSIVIIDAGHGGEDGGAISKSGLYEKDINLSVALILRDYFASVGVPTVLTRDSDVLLYDKNSDYHGRKKVMDLSNRRLIAESIENPLFISIHMNSFTQEQYNGLQVWYSKNHALSKEIAQEIQAASRRIMASNYRVEKAADSKLFLLDNLDCPAVLVECGFLSNAAEADKLATYEYQRKLAYVIFTASVQFLDLS